MGVTLAVAAVVLAYPLAQYTSGEVTTAVIVGAVLSTVNALLGFLTIEYAFEKSYTTFLKAVVVGMGLRMMLLLGTLLVLVLWVRMHPVALVVSVVGFYVLFLILEILYLQNKVVVKNQG
jgi:hypothetical protein